MRIISGTNRGRKLTPPVSLPVRPTTDFAKEGLFNLLANLIDFDKISVLDIFSGTGNIAYEFASRGSKSITAVDQNKACAKYITDTAEKIGFKNLDVFNRDAFSFLKTTPKTYDLIFADPPYDMENTENIHEIVFERKLLNKNGLLVIEHSAAKHFAYLDHFLQVRNYGSVHFSFFKCEDKETQSEQE